MANIEPSKGEIVMYQPDETIRLEVRVENETVWLNRQQMATLFGRDVKTIGKHVNNALHEELANVPTVANFAIVQNEGGRLVNRNIEFYNLDMVLSVGYRVKSDRGIKFRQWANRVLKEYLIKGYAVNNRIEKLEQRVAKTEEKIDFFVRIYDGQIFDAYAQIISLIKQAKRSVVLIDNYISADTLTMLSNRDANVSATIYTQKVSGQLQLDIDKHNAQYPPVKVELFNKAHDRFLLIDDEVHHIGASIKDLGKKWFAFTLLKDIKSDELIRKMQESTI